MIILSSMVCLSPVILALMVYSELPEKLVVSWNLAGNPNRYAHKAVIVFGFPLFFMARQTSS
jgi:uncharacterized membrane protein